MSDRFQAHFTEQYGERWCTLYSALAEPVTRHSVTDGLLMPYHMDDASVCVANLLPLDGAEAILDLCAAPGGKALILATKMNASARLTANERSSARRARMHRVLTEHLPPDVRERVHVTGHDARRWGLHETNTYCAVLADVPCSSERHLIHSVDGTDGWNPRRSKRLAIDQFAILAAGIDACRPGGFVLYATCALSRFENDAVVARALVRRAVDEVTPYALRAGDALPTGPERTAHGVQILPDHASGSGPMYAALLQKRAGIG